MGKKMFVFSIHTSTSIRRTHYFVHRMSEMMALCPFEWIKWKYSMCKMNVLKGAMFGNPGQPGRQIEYAIFVFIIQL